MDRSSTAALAGSLQSPRFMALVNLYAGKIIGSKAPEVDLHVLRVVKLETVEEHAGVLAAEAPDIDGLEPAYPTVVLHLHSPEKPHGIGDIVRDLQPRSTHGVRRRHYAHPSLLRRHHRHRQRIRRLSRPGRQRQHHHSCHRYYQSPYHVAKIDKNAQCFGFRQILTNFRVDFKNTR